MAPFPFRNLVLQGGGVKTFAYHGALYVLEEAGILEQIERVAGTSAGALLALLLSFRLSVEETVALLRTVDYAQATPSSRSSRLLEQELERLRGNLSALARMVRNYGWFSNEYARHWLEQVVAAHCEGNGQATFADLRRLGFRDLYIVATNLSTRSVEIFSAETTPQAPVAAAVVLSGSLPFFFEAPRFDGRQLGRGDLYVDGAVLMNYPLEILDDPRFAAGSAHFVHGINWETLGLRTYTPAGLEQPRPINNLITFGAALFETVAAAQEVAFESDPVDCRRTINISDCGVATTDFEVRPDPDNPTYQMLLQAGESAAREYLESYRLSTDRLYAIRARLSQLLARRRRAEG